MPRARPELVILSGPAKGTRTVLMTDSVTLGRASTCDIRIPEPSVSRHQLTFTADPEGWLVENVAQQAVRINDDKYKSGRKAYLETGDALYLGTGTVALFVSAGDDPDHAARAFLQEHPEIAQAHAAIPPSGPSDEPTLVILPAAPGSTVEPPTSGLTEDPTTAAPEDEITRQRRRKLIKYGVIAVVYLAVLVAVFVALHSLKRKPGIFTEPSVLSDERIQAILREEYPPGRLPHNAVLAEKYLQEARRTYRDRDLSPDNLFRCVKHYKLYLGCRGAQRFEQTQDERQYIDAMQDLCARVTEIYRTAYVASQNNDWAAARRAYMAMLDMLPVGEDPEPESQHPLVINVQDHLGRVNRNSSGSGRR